MKAPLPDGFTSRAETLDDVPAVVALINAHSREFLGVEPLTEQRLRTQSQTPGFDLENDARLVLDETGQIIGEAYVIDLADPHVQIRCESVVHAKYRDQGIGSYLLDWAEERARQAIPKAPEGARVVLTHGVLEQDEPTQQLLAQHGFTPVRHFWRMVIEMEAPPPSPQWPEGITPSTFAANPDDCALTLAVRDAFKDHWGYVESPIEEELDRWRYRTAHDPDFDPSLWFLAMDKKEIAGVSMCWPKAHEDRTWATWESSGFAVPGVVRGWD